MRIVHVLLALAVCVSAAYVQRSSTPPEKDMFQVTIQAQSLDATLTAFQPSQGLGDAMNVQQTVVTFNKTILIATSNAKAAGALAEAESQNIYDDMQSLKAAIVHALDQLVSKESYFQALAPRIEIDVITVQASLRQYFVVLTAIAVVDLQVKIQILGGTIVDSFDAAIAAYASSSRN